MKLSTFSPSPLSWLEQSLRTCPLSTTPWTPPITNVTASTSAVPWPRNALTPTSATVKFSSKTSARPTMMASTLSRPESCSASCLCWRRNPPTSPVTSTATAL